MIEPNAHYELYENRGREPEQGGVEGCPANFAVRGCG